VHGFGRALQFLGLSLPITGLLMGLQSQGSEAMQYEFGLLALGAAVFFIGWKMQGSDGE
jgi:hypothetical protein